MMAWPMERVASTSDGRPGIGQHMARDDLRIGLPHGARRLDVLLLLDGALGPPTMRAKAGM